MNRLTPASIVSATLLAFPPPAAGYERDLHYSVTFVLAVASGWGWDQARVIASADQGVDENKETVAALEISRVVPSTGSLAAAAIKGHLVHQAPQNFLWHAFSKVPGDQKQLFIPEVEGQLTDCRKRLDPLLPPAKGKASLHLLIALGVHLHCEQDAGAHHGYGGKCGSFPGNCTAHTWSSHRDKPDKRTNPDHPIVKPEANLMAALHKSARALADVRKAIGLSARWVDEAGLRELAARLRQPAIARMDDAARIECHREAAGEWLLAMVKKGHLPMPPQASQQAPSKGCGLKETHIPLPAPEYPKFDWSANARISGDSYATVRGAAKFDLAIEQLTATQRCSGPTCWFKLRVQVSNMGNSSSQPSLVLLAILPGDREQTPFGAVVHLPPMDKGRPSVAEVEVQSPHEKGPLERYLAHADVQPRRRGEGEWLDADVSNDTLSCLAEAKGECAARAGSRHAQEF